MILVVVECKMMNKKNGAVLFSTVYFNAVLAGSFPTNREPFRWLVASGLLPAAVAHKDSRYSKAQYSRAGRLNSLRPILHRGD